MQRQQLHPTLDIMYALLLLLLAKTGAPTHPLLEALNGLILLPPRRPLFSLSLSPLVQYVLQLTGVLSFVFVRLDVEHTVRTRTHHESWPCVCQSECSRSEDRA